MDMKKFCASILCGFIPSKEKRQVIRKVLLNKCVPPQEPQNTYLIDYRDGMAFINQGIYCNESYIKLSNNVLLQKCMNIYEGTIIG